MNGYRIQKRKDTILLRIINERILMTLTVALAVVLAAASVSFGATYKTVGGTKYYHPSRYTTKQYKVYDGVDVSVFNGNINWTKVKKTGVDFAFIRCGGTYGKSTFTQYGDSWYSSNVTEARGAGMDIGVYYFSLAKTKTEAKKEVSYVLEKLQQKDIPKGTPVIMDYEFLPGSRLDKAYDSWKKKGVGYARKKVTNIAVYWMDLVAEAGYRPVFYSYRAMIDPAWSGGFRFDMSRINGANQYPFWLAQYSTSLGYTGNIEYWQYTSTGGLSGVTGNIDRNFWYFDNINGTGTKEGAVSIRDMDIALQYREMKYTGYKREPAVTVMNGSVPLTEGVDYTLAYMDNVKTGTASVLVRGIGYYSNTARLTFRVGAADRLSDTYYSGAPEKVQSPTATVSASDSSLTVSVTEADHADKYQYQFRVNGGKWVSYESNSTKMKKVFQDGDIAAVRVRGINVVPGSEETTETQRVYGPFSSVKYRYIGSGPSVSTHYYPSPRHLAVSWKEEPMNIGTGSGAVMAYDMAVSKDGGSYQKQAVSGLSLDVPAASRSYYCFRVRPSVTFEGHKYYGIYGGKSGCRLISSSKVVSVTSSGRTVTVKTNKQKAAERYCFYLADNSGMKGRKKITSSKTTAVFRGLKKGKKYYVRVRSYVKRGGVIYYGAYSARKKIVCGR